MASHMPATHGRAAARWQAEADRLTRERERTAATRPKQLAVATGYLSSGTAPFSWRSAHHPWTDALTCSTATAAAHAAER